MRLLTVSDEVVPILYQAAVPQLVGPVDLILSCGDLPPSYLEFLVTVINAPCFYVRGNHDGTAELREEGSYRKSPEGWENIDLRSVEVGGLLLAGIEGSIRYNDGPVQYTEQEMSLRLWRLALRMVLNKYRYGRYLDILITHAPPAGIHEGPGPHRGFAAIRRFVERFQPRYLIHGHVHLRYGYGDQRPARLGQTLVINTCGYQLLEIDEVTGNKVSSECVQLRCEGTALGTER